MPYPWLVLKFGGTSVASSERWDVIADQVRKRLKSHRVIIVSSALAGITNLLEAAIKEAKAGDPSTKVSQIKNKHYDLVNDIGIKQNAIAPLEELWAQLESWLEGIRLTGEAPPRLCAKILATGELASTHLGCAALVHHGLKARWVDVRNLLVSHPNPIDPEEHRFLDARIKPVIDPDRCEKAAAGSDLVITQGFIAKNEKEETCLLGRGGSDTSAALIAALCQAKELEIWTDVPGLFTADPREIPTARLIQSIGYREAQELASLGAKVLHPRCLEPVAWAGIPLTIYSTENPQIVGTRIEKTSEAHPAVTALTCRSNVTLVSLSTLAMCETPGFLARTFQPFADLGISVDLVGTSEASVSVTLDKIPGGVNGSIFAGLLLRLRELGEVSVISNCCVVSIVGRRIRAVLPEIGGALTVFRDKPIHLVSNSSEDLNLSFVVDGPDGPPLVEKLHDRLFSSHHDDPRLGPSWEMIQKGSSSTIETSCPWWSKRQEELCSLVQDGQARYVYHLPTVEEKARCLVETIKSVSRFFYSMKANSHPKVLQSVYSQGFGIECVSAAEVLRAKEVLGPKCSLLFTPNFCPIDEYKIALDAGAEIIVDGAHLFDQAPQLFKGTKVGVRVDPGWGLGHHEKVRTGGARAKFGQPIAQFDDLLEKANRLGVSIVGLHAHVGSGIFSSHAWAEVGEVLASLIQHVGTKVKWLDLGGGLGVPEHPGQSALDLEKIEKSLRPLKDSLGDIELRMEPGRFLVSEAGVLITPVTQVRQKDGLTFVGTATGMNSLIRPSLYGAWHAIYNLTRLNDKPSNYVHVVGPICESGDVLGRDRWLPSTYPGDVLLIECAGAYGAVMSSQYNLRQPAQEVVIE